MATANYLITKQSVATELAHACANGYARLIDKSARYYGVPLYYALAVASQESSIGMYFDRNPSAKWVGDDGSSWGIMQINVLVAGHARALARNGVQTPWDHAGIIDYGIEHLAALKATGRSWFEVFTAYNAGPDCRSDACTTRGRYGSDVTLRSEYFRQIRASRTSVCASDSAGWVLPVPNQPPGDVVLSDDDNLPWLSPEGSLAAKQLPWWTLLLAGAGVVAIWRTRQ